MSSMLINLIIVFVGIMATAMVFLVRYLNAREEKKRALSIISGQAVNDKEESQSSIQNKRRASLAKKLNEQKEGATKKKSHIKLLIQQSGIQNLSVKKYWVICAVSGLLFTAIAKFMGMSIPVLIAVFLIFSLGLPKKILTIKVNRRQKKFLEELPDALESMVRLLKAGMPVGEAISMVSREYTGPVGDEMSKVYDEQKIGIPLAEACQHAAERMPITEMQMFATGITIQQQTGSSLSEILLNLAKVIRARFRLRRKVQALSAEAKASAMIIGSLPVVVCLGMSFINPDYMYPLFSTIKGKMFLYGSIGWMMCGVLIMRQMINFKI